MKPTDATTNALLASRQFFVSDLITVTLQNGTTLTYCSGPVNIVYLGSTYTAGGKPDGTAFGGPYWDRRDNKAKVVWRVGTAVDQLVIDVIPGAAQVGNMSFMNAIRVGLFDNADFQLRRLFMPSSAYGTVLSSNCGVLMFQGSVGLIDVDRAVATFTIDDYRQLLNLQMPKWLFAPTCQNTLYDANCTVVESSFASSGFIASGSSFAQVAFSTTNSSGITGQVSGYFDNGKIVVNTGLNAGLSFAISSWNQITETISFTSPAPFTFSTTDSVTAYPGCDRSTGAGGCTKFNNLPNFRGMPYIPDPGTAF